MRAALDAREASQIKAVPSINAVSRKMVRDGRSVDRMLAWEAEKRSKLESKRIEVQATQDAELHKKVAMGQQSRRILSLKEQRSSSPASSRLYSLGKQRQQARRGEPEPIAQRSSSAARSRSKGTLYERGRAASAARDTRLASLRGGEAAMPSKAASAPRPRPSSRAARAARHSQGGSAAASEHTAAAVAESTNMSATAMRSRLFAGRASSAPRARRSDPEAALPQPAAAYGAFIHQRRGVTREVRQGGVSQRAASPSRQTGASVQPVASTAASSSRPGHGVALAAGWFQYKDKTSGRPYFFHPASNVVTWKKPQSVAPPQPGHLGPALTTGASIPAVSPSAADSDWVQAAGGHFASRFAAVAASLADN
jgi:hypothetical protein